MLKFLETGKAIITSLMISYQIYLSESRIIADYTDFADFLETDCQHNTLCVQGIREQSGLETFLQVKCQKLYTP